MKNNNNKKNLIKSQVNGQNAVIPWAVVTAESEKPTVRRGTYSLGRKSITL